MNQKRTGHYGSNPPRNILEELAFFAGAPHECGYLPDRTSVSLFADPEAEMDVEIFNVLLEHGFRRSGSYVYRPHCPLCKACLAARIPVNQFSPNRNQARTYRRGTYQQSEIKTTITEAAFNENQFTLYRKYMSARHTGGGMDDSSPIKYMEFLTSAWAHTEFVEFRENNRLIAVAITDVLPRGLSSVYTFFDPNYKRLSLGRYALLWQINEARRRQLPHLYLGYWIKNCQKMLYKREYRPLDLFLDNRWQTFDRSQDLPEPYGG